MVLNYINWDVSPLIFSLGPVQVRWYGLLFAMAFVVGYKIMEYVYRHSGLDNKEVDRLSLNMIISVVIGARLGHVLFYEPRDYFDPSSPNFRDYWEVFRIWNGGLASHGAAIGILIGMFIYTRKGPVRSYMWILDRIILTVPIGGFFVRMGNLMNSEIYGKPTDKPWAFNFLRDPEACCTPGEVDLAKAGLQQCVCPRHPTQIYEGVGYVLIFIFLMYLYRRAHYKPKPGMLFGLFLILLFGLRFIVEFFKVEQVDWEKSSLLSTIGLNMGQLLSIPFIIIGIFILIRSNRLQPGERI